MNCPSSGRSHAHCVPTDGDRARRGLASGSTEHASGSARSSPMSEWSMPGFDEWTAPGYTEQRLLGRGVSGRVVAAVEETTGQRVAIKYFDDNLVVRDTDFLPGFRSDAERLISLDSPHVARLIDYAEQPGQGAAIVMALVEGVSLREVIARGGPLGAEAALVVLRDSLLG